MDGSSLSVSSTGLKVAAGGITYAMIAAAAIGTGSSQIAAGDHDHGASGAGASEYWGTDASSALGWHSLPSSGTQRKIETFTLGSADITNGYVTLSSTPGTAGEVVLMVRGFGAMFYGQDYEMDAGYTTRLTWSGKSLASLLESGDQLTVIY